MEVGVAEDLVMGNSSSRTKVTGSFKVMDTASPSNRVTEASSKAETDSVGMVFPGKTSGAAVEVAEEDFVVVVVVVGSTSSMATMVASSLDHLAVVAGEVAARILLLSNRKLKGVTSGEFSKQ